VGPVRVVLGHAFPVAPLLGLFFVVTLGFAIAWLNLIVLFQALLWLAGGLPIPDLSWWQPLLHPQNSDFLLITLAGAALVVEPFWLVFLVVFVARARARTSGEDLRRRFRELQTAEPSPEVLPGHSDRFRREVA
jgi:hypothetical protein